MYRDWECDARPLDCSVYFPEYIDGKVNTDPESSLDESRELYGTVIDSDDTVDLALIQLEDDLPEGIVALELAEKSASPGQTIHAIAGTAQGSQSLWTYSTGHVRQITRGMLANDTVEKRLKWQGQHLALRFEEMGGWILFSNTVQ